jgi:hypothetical protein
VFVAHAVDDGLSVVTFGEDGAKETLRRWRIERGHANQGFALASMDGTIFAPQVDADSEGVETYYGGSLMTPFVEIVEETSAAEPAAEPAAATATAQVAERGGSPSMTLPVFRTQGSRGRGPATMPHCLLPRAATVRQGDHPHLLVACMGDETLVEFLTRSPTAQLFGQRRRELPGGVTGLAYDAASDAAIAWAQDTRQLLILSLAEPPKSTELERAERVEIDASGASLLDAEVRFGRRIFHGAGDLRLSADGRACASCHPDGRDDGRTWNTPDGRRQTMSLAGRLSDTAPYGWTRHAPSLSAYFADTIKRLNGRGLPPRETHALEKYLLSLSVPSRAARPESPLAARGKKIFESSEAGCSSCHVGEATTDGREHDVGSVTTGDRSNGFATPSLRFISKTAPYFHDGRYLDLRALLTTKGSKMGSTSHLGPEDIDALESYLRTL